MSSTILGILVLVYLVRLGLLCSTTAMASFARFGSMGVKSADLK